jgi:hypothetical protein
MQLETWAAHFWDGTCCMCGRERPHPSSASPECWFFGGDKNDNWAAKCFLCVSIEELIEASVEED